jgi:hypothetical protein
MRRLQWQSRLPEPGLRRGGKRGGRAPSEASLVGQEEEDFLGFFFFASGRRFFFYGNLVGLTAWMYVFIIVKASYSFIKVIGLFNQRS